jgi:SAM-dependent methyltransferase
MSWMPDASWPARRTLDLALAFARWPAVRRLVSRLAGDEAKAARGKLLLLQRVREGIYNLGYRLAGANDGYPFPPARLVYAVIGNWQLSWYQLGGMFMHQSMVTLLATNGIDSASLRTILDFGCGCGRILRFWSPAQHELWGSDYNSTLVDWCRRRLDNLARFSVNRPDPPLDFAAERFDLVYAYSVFTHLAREQQGPWFRELTRVLKPGGLLLVTVQGPSCAARQGLADQLAEAGILVFGGERAGTNACVVYHSERYVVEELGRGLELVDYVPRGAVDTSGMDVYLFRTPLAKAT